jgi:hypothetical protein
LFQISSDLAQRLDDVAVNMPGLSFTLLVNQAIDQWLQAPTFAPFSLKDLKSMAGEAVTIKKSANISALLVEEIEKAKNVMPGFNATLIINLALWNWIANPKLNIPNTPYTDKDVDEFLSENAKLMDRLAE